MNESEDVQGQPAEREFEDLLRQAEASWQTLLKEKSTQLTRSDSPDIPSDE